MKKRIIVISAIIILLIVSFAASLPYQTIEDAVVTSAGIKVPFKYSVLGLKKQYKFDDIKNARLHVLANYADALAEEQNITVKFELESKYSTIFIKKNIRLGVFSENGKINKNIEKDLYEFKYLYNKISPKITEVNKHNGYSDSGLFPIENGNQAINDCISYITS